MPSLFALIVLLGLSVLALFPDPRLLPPDALLPEKITLIFLSLAFLMAFWPRLSQKLVENRSASTFLLLCAGFLLFHLAERAGPRDGWALQFALLPGDHFSISYALRLAVLGALTSLPAWIKSGGPSRFVLAALLLIGGLGWGSFWFLSHYFPVGPTETLDPTPLPTLFLQLLGYGCVAALCRAITASPVATRLALRVFPLLLLGIGAKFGFFPTPLPPEEAESITTQTS